MSRAHHNGMLMRARVGAPIPEFSDVVVLRARLIRERGGYTAREVQQHLSDEGHQVPIGTLEGWLDGTTRRFAGFPK